MVSPHRLSITKRLARVQKYNFISEKKNTNNKIILHCFEESVGEEEEKLLEEEF